MYIFLYDTLQVNAVLEQHERTAKQEFSNDIVYRRMVSEPLQAVTMATSAMQVYASAVLDTFFVSSYHLSHSFGSKTALLTCLRFKVSVCWSVIASCSGY